LQYASNLLLIIIALLSHNIHRMRQKNNATIYMVLAHLSNSNSRTFQGPYEGYISKGMRIEVPKAPRGWTSWGGDVPLHSQLGGLGSVVSSPGGVQGRAIQTTNKTTHSRHISGPHKPSSLIQALSRTMSVFKDFSGLENLGKNSRTFKDPQQP